MLNHSSQYLFPIRGVMIVWLQVYFQNRWHMSCSFKWILDQYDIIKLVWFVFCFVKDYGK